MTSPSRGTRISLILGFIAHHIVSIARAWTQAGCAILIAPVIYIYARITTAHKLQRRTTEDSNLLRGASLQFGTKKISSYRLSPKAVASGLFDSASKLKLSVSRSTLTIFAVVLVLAPLGALSLGLFDNNEVQAATNEQINFQARLLTAGGGLVPDGNYNVQFTIYSGGDGELGGGDETLEWSGSHLNTNSDQVVVKNGYVSARLGSSVAQVNTLASVDWDDPTLWLSINIGNTGSGTPCTSAANFNSNCGGDGEMDPFMRFTSTPYAFNSKQLGGRTASEFVQLDPGATPQLVTTSNSAIAVNQAGTGNLIQLQDNGTNRFVIADGGAATLTGTLQVSGATTIQSGSFTVGTTTQLGAITLYDGSSNTTTLQAGSTSGNLVFTLPTSYGSSNQCVTTTDGAGTLAFNSCAAGGLQAAYEAVNTITATNAEGDIDLTISEATNFSVDMTGTGSFLVQDAGTTVLEVDPDKRTIITGSSSLISISGSIDPVEGFFGSTTITGVGTSFTTQVKVGDQLVINNESRTVIEIASNTSLTVGRTFNNAGNDTSPEIIPAMLSIRNNAGLMKFSVNERAAMISNTSTRTDAESTGGLVVTVVDTGIVTTGTDDTTGGSFSVTRTGASGGTINSNGVSGQATGDTGGTSTAIGVNGQALNADTNIGVQGSALQVAAGAVTETTGVMGSAFGYFSSGTIAQANGLKGGVGMDGTGVITSGAGLRVISAVTSGSGAITNNYGIYVENQTGGGTDYGIYVADAQNYSLYLASTDGDAASGITFGSDTNLYRITNNELHTDDAFSASGTITSAGGLFSNNGLTIRTTATDITTDTNEDLTVVANGSGQIILNDLVQVSTLGTADGNTILCRNSSNQIATCTPGFDSSVTLQDAYDNSTTPATITSADNKNLAITLADTATDSDMVVTLQGSGNNFEIYDGAVKVFGVNGDGTATITSTSVTVGANGNASDSVDIISGYTGGINIGAGANNQKIDVGSSNSTYSTIVIGSTNSNALSTTTVRGGSAINAVDIYTGSGGGVAIQNSGLAGSVQIGSTTGAVAQTINIGNNATASSTTTLTVGSTIGTSTTTINAGSGGIAVNGTTTVTSPGGAAAALIVNNSTSTGNILTLQDNGTSVLTVVDTGAAIFQNATDSTAGFRVMDQDGGTPILNIDTTNERVGIGTATPGALLDIAGATVGTNGSALRVLATTTNDGGIADAAISAQLTASPASASSMYYSGLAAAGTSSSANLGAGTLAGVGASSTYSGTATLGAAVGVLSSISNTSTGTISQAAGVLIADAINSGGGTITASYGIYVQSQTAGASDYGIRIDSADTQTLWLTGDGATASTGIGFGASRDTNLYRSAASMLRTDDGLTIALDATISGGDLTLGTASSINGAIALQNSTNAFAVTITAPNQTVGSATISLPNTAGVADTFCLVTLANCGDSSVTLQDAYQNGNTIVATNAEGDIDLTVSEATNFSVDITGTGSFLVQDSGSTILSVADGTGRVDVTGDLDVSSQLAVGNAASATANQVLTVNETSTSTSISYGINSIMNMNAAGAATGGVGVSGSATTQAGNAQDYGALYGVFGNATHNGTSEVSQLYGLVGQVGVTAAGSVTSAAGIAVFDATNAGTIQNNYGLYIGEMAAGTNDYGIYIEDAQNYSLYLASTDGDAASGITFGSDTNLYRSAASMLRTDDSLTIALDATISGGDLTLGTASSVNGAIALQNSTNAFAVTITAPNQTVGSATISLPNTAGVADTFCLLTLNNCNVDTSVTLQDAYQNGNTIVATNAEGDIDLTVSEATNFSVDITGTGSFLVQDSGTAVLTVADGGATTFQNSTDTTSGFRVMDQDGGTPIFNIDTTNERVGIGTATPGSSLDIGGYGTSIVSGAQTGIRLLQSFDGIGGLEFKNGNTGTSADSRFLAAASDNSYIAVAQPGINNSTTLFDQARGTGSYIFSIANGGTARDLIIGTVDAKDLVFGSSNNARGRVTAAGLFQFGSANQFQISASGILSNTTGNLVLDDVVDLGSATTGLNVTTFGTLSDIDGNVVINDQADIGSSTTGIRVTTAGFISDIDGNLVLSDVVDIGSSTTGINVTTAGVLSDIDGNLMLTDTIDINVSANNDTNINTGTSTGAVSIGNSAAGAIAVQSASTIGLTGTTTVTGLTSGVALTVNNSTSVGAIFIAQDNGVAAFTIADGGGVTGTGTYTFSGVSTDITTGANEDLTILANGAGQIILNDTVQVATLGTADTNTILCRNAANQIATCTPGFDSSVTLQDAYANGNTIVATDAEGDIDLTVSEATNFTVDITGTGVFAVQDSGTNVLSVTNGSATTITNADGGSDVALTVNGAASTGNILNVQDGGSTVFSVADGATTTLTQANAADGLVINSSNASQVSSSGLKVTQSGTTTGFTGNFVDFIGSSTTGAGNTLNVTGVNTTAGNTVNVANNAITTGDVVDLNHTTSVITTGAVLRVSSTSTDTFSAGGGLLDVSSTAAFTSTANAGLVNIRASHASQVSGTLLNVLQTGVTTGYTGNVVAITGSNTTGAGNTLSVTGVNTTAGNTVNVTNNAITTGDTVDLNHTTSVITTGAVLRVSSTAVNTFSAGGGLIDVLGSAAFTSTANAGLVNIRANSASQVSGTLLNVLQTGVTTGYTGNVVAITGASTTGAGNTLSVTGVNTTAGNTANITNNAITTGDIVDINHTTSVITTGAALRVSSTSVDTFSAGGGLIDVLGSAAFTSTANAGLVNIRASSASQVSGTLLNVLQTGVTTGYTGNVAAITGSSTTGAGNVLSVTSAGTTAGNAINVTADALTTGDAVDINSTSTGITTGSLLKVTTATTGAVATNGIVSIAATGAYTSTSNAGLLNVNASATTAGTIVNIQGGALTTGTALNIAANSGNGIVVSTTGTDISSGTNEDLTIAANGTGNFTLNASTSTINNANGGTDVALTVNGGTSTGNILNIQDNGSNVLTIADGGLTSILGDVDFGDATSDTISFVGRVDTNITPSTNNAVDLGETTLRWKDLYAATSFNLGANGDDSTFTYNTTLNRTELDTALEVERNLTVDGAAIQAITGTIDPSDFATFSIFASTTVTGVGTQFLSEVNVGDILHLNGEARTVVSISSNTVLVVDSIYMLAGNDTSPEITPGGLTIMSSAGAGYFLANERNTIVSVSSTSTNSELSSGFTLNVTDTGVTAGTDDTRGASITVTKTGASGGTITTYGLTAQATGDTAGTQTVTGLLGSTTGGDYQYGVTGQSITSGSSTITAVTGVQSLIAGLFSTANITELNGFETNINLSQNTSGTVTDTAGLRVGSVTDDGGMTFTNLYGVIVENQLEGNTNYGLYVDHAAGGTDYGLYVDDSEISSIYLASADGDAASGITFSGGNVNLYASSSTTLRTDDNFQLGEGADKTIDVQTRTSNAAGRSLTIAAGAAGTGGSAFTGGALNLQGGAAAGTGNANGGNILLTGGAGVGTGVNGLVVIGTPTFQTASSQNCAGADCTITQANVDANGAVIVTFSSTGFEAAMPDPVQTTAGKIVYVTAAAASSDFTLCLNDVAAGGSYDGTCNLTTGNSIAMRANTTATLVWNGGDWTAAGASSSTDLQAAYNNTLTSAGGAELVLNASGGAADGLTIRNNATTPISGALLEVQASIGNNLFSVNSNATEYVVNGGAETSSSFATDWTAVGAPTITRTTTAGQFATGLAATQVSTTAAANTGVRNNLSTNLTTSTQYQVSFTAKLSSGTFSTLDVQYSRDGGTDLETCTSYSTQTLSTSGWTKITCVFTTDGTTATNPDLIIRQTDATSRIFWVDNLSVTLSTSSSTPPNVQIGGGSNGGTVTLLTLDQSSSPPVADGLSTYYGSMYYDTVTGRIQCYEADGWGACGSPPNNIITLTPEYAGAVLNGTGVGTMQADFCSDQSGILQVNDTLCDTGEVANYYEWTSPQATSQTYSIYVTFQLPDTFDSFSSNNTITLDARTTDTTDASVNYELFRSTGSAITECGSDTTVTSSNDTWQTVAHNGSENSGCSFTGGDRVIFKLNMIARNNDSVYVSDINFTYTND